jgi:hypothetical protein
MAKIEDFTIKFDAELTEAGKQVVRKLIDDYASTSIREAVDVGCVVFPSEEALRTFIRDEVRKVLDEEVRGAQLEVSNPSRPAKPKIRWPSGNR